MRRIAVIPGDGIGVEVTEAARQVLDAVARRHRIALAYDEFKERQLRASPTRHVRSSRDQRVRREVL
ncbi:hypothetical protein [Plantactinospora sp. ZYX-F-223]|uniref:hypothetical protein n=1 Tax=Plantactinospora sp. ZYX-F-223 TaxID=3144103 RepID=UPI0031FD0DD2